MNPAPFPDIRFAGTLRTSQAEVVNIARQKLRDGVRRLHIVAPPGSGKTILGLYLWAHLIRRPAIVLSPNSAIQAQWAARTDLFQFHPDANQGDMVDHTANAIPVPPTWISTSASGNDYHLLTSLTYQSVTMPQRGNEDWDRVALELWKQRLVEKGEAQDLSEAAVWIEDLHAHNPEYYEDRLSVYRKRHRDDIAADGNSFELLHRSSQETLLRARQAGVGLLILDECHHLIGHWGRVLSEAIQWLGDPIVIGLTATPPDITGKSPTDVRLYEELLGEIQYQVPVPAVVKDGFLAPYQDLVYFVRPSGAELSFVAKVDQHFRALLLQLCQPTANREPADRAAEIESPGTATHPSIAAHQDGVGEIDNIPLNLVAWVAWTLQHLKLPQGRQVDWREFERRDPTFADAGRLFLLVMGRELPSTVPHVTVPSELQSLRARNLKSLQSSISRLNAQQPSAGSPLGDAAPSKAPPDNALSFDLRDDPQLMADQLHDLPLDLLTPILDRFVRHRLRRSPVPEQQQLAQTLIARLRTFGVQITETGVQACASPVSRVLAYSREKASAMVTILEQEWDLLGDRIRAVVITDFEKTSAVQAEIRDVLDEHVGGAIAAFRRVVEHQRTNRLDPILLTGSTVLVDADLAEKFLQQASRWLAQRALRATLSTKTLNQSEAPFCQILGAGPDWSPRVYVEMITELFQAGVTRCLIGTRGLLGEGWDASRINVLVDLTTVTTSMSINQLRGRSIRLDRHWPEKTANNWDVVCVSPEFAKGFDDYHRFKKKHQWLFGVADDGEIEKGAGHVHPAFLELQPQELEGKIGALNQEMLQRATRREQAREAWRIGQPYLGQITHTVEVRDPAAVASAASDASAARPARQFAPFGWRSPEWNAQSLTKTIGKVVLLALQSLHPIGPAQAETVARDDDFVRISLSRATPEIAKRFADAMSQVLGPIDNARYIIPREVDVLQANWISQWFPEMLGQWLHSKHRGIAMWHAVPDVLASKKEDVLQFEKLWNQWVSPGQALFALRGQGQQTLEEMLNRGQTPSFQVNQSEVFR